MILGHDLSVLRETGEGDLRERAGPARVNLLAPGRMTLPSDARNVRDRLGQYLRERLAIADTPIFVTTFIDMPPHYL